MAGSFEVGDLVRSGDRPDWGVGQVQSLVGDRLTVTFENAGKVVLISGSGSLVLVSSDWS